jgi:Fic family protein
LPTGYTLTVRGSNGRIARILLRVSLLKAFLRFDTLRDYDQYLNFLSTYFLLLLAIAKL